MIRILVPGVPVGKGRPRMTRSGHCYTPEKTRIYEDKIAFFGHQAMAGKRPLEGYLTIQVEAVFPVPESWSKKKKKMALDGKLFPGRPDIDNILKAIDGLNGVVWKDDAQIILAVVSKRYGNVPHLAIDVDFESPPSCEDERCNV